MTDPVDARIEEVLGQSPRRRTALSGGCVGEVWGVTMPDGNKLVAKVDRGSGGALDLEGWMLELLRPHLPVPEVVHADSGLLLMEWLPGGTGCDAAAERHAAQLLAHLHGVAAPRVGLERDTLIGGLHQPNPQAESWLPFFAEHRLVYMAGCAHAHGRLDAATVARVERVAGRLTEWLDEPATFSLLHGDVWSGNVLSERGRITGFLDPAVYYGHREVELAFVTMFSTFGGAFFEEYSERHPVDRDFHEVRRHVYNLYPYLVHVRLFGGGYVQSVQSILGRFGC